MIKVRLNCVPRLLMLVFLFAPSMAATAVTRQQSADVVSIPLTEISSIVRVGSPDYQLYEPEQLMLPPELLGITADAQGNVYLCDAVSEQLVKISPDGFKVFSVGSKGEGPEDHTSYGDPILLPDNLLIRTDCSYSGKLLVYDTNGSYLKSISLAGVMHYSRIWWFAGGGLAMAMDLSASGNGNHMMRSLLIRFSQNGEIIQKREVGQHVFPPAGEKTDESDWWLFPVISIDELGNVYFQPSADSKIVTCLDKHLTKKWDCEGDWVSPRRSDDFIEKARSHSGPMMRISPVDRALRRIVARSNNRVWIQPNRLDLRAADTFFVEYGPGGVRQREIELEGLPALPGDYVIHGDLLIWQSDDDLEATDLPIPYLKVFRIPASE